MRHALILLLLATTPAVSAPPLRAGEEPDPADQTMLAMRIAGAVLASYRDAHERLPDLGADPVPPSRVADALGEKFGEPLPDRDGWGNRFRYVVHDGSYTITSPGADGRIDDWDAPADEGNGDDVGSAFLRDLPLAIDAPDTPERDIVFQNGQFLVRPEPRKLPAEKAMDDVREIGLALEYTKGDDEAGAYPGPTGRLLTIDALAGALEDAGANAVPRTDPWGFPYLVWTDGGTYLVVCTGADGRPDVDYKAPGDLDGALEDVVIETFTPEADIVFANGRFVRYPDGLDDD